MVDPWYKVVTLREEVREGRSFSPDEFAIALEQVVAGTAPADYTDAARFFARTYFTSALTQHAGVVLRRLSGETANTAPVLSLITQFGVGKTHTLTSLYHLAEAGRDAARLPGVADLLQDAGLSDVPEARVGVFVGNSWDPSAGKETPWLDLARQLAGEQGVAALGDAAANSPPGTEALSKLFAAARGPVLLLFDEVLNFINRHEPMADSFHSFIQNLTVATTGTPCAAAVISLPRSQVEMTDRDLQWQERITKVVRRVGQDLITQDETEISEVVRRRLFEDLGKERPRTRVAKSYADWCFERAHLLPREWTAVDTAMTETKGRDRLQRRFAGCYPFHPATLSVFQRKWRALPQFQQTRGALAMLAQWVSWAARDQFRQARHEPLITLGSAPLHVPAFWVNSESRASMQPSARTLRARPPEHRRSTSMAEGLCATSIAGSGRQSSSSRRAGRLTVRRIFPSCGSRSESRRSIRRRWTTLPRLLSGSPSSCAGPGRTATAFTIGRR